MSRTSDSRKDVNENSDDAKVIQLGFNISVAGKSASDFEIYVNDRKQPCGQLSIQNLEQGTSDSKVSELMGEKYTGQSSLDKVSEKDELTYRDLDRQKNERSPLTAASGETEGSKSSRSEDVTIIDEIKNAMGNFEKFSEHLKEIPRLSTKRMYTSTPFPEKNNSRSEGNLSLYGHAPRSYIPKHDFRDRKYFKKPKPLSNDLFLKPLPAEDYFKKGFVRRYYDVESYHHYASVDNLPHYYEYGGEWKNTGKSSAKSDNDKSDAMSSASDVCVSETKALAKKDGNEPVDKQSTSSESAKDIKIYQSGGIIIMQNFKDGADLIDKDLVDSAKLIENCNKLKEKIETSLHSSDESQKLLLNSSSDDVKGQATKSVQFDLSSCENYRSKSCDSSPDMPKNDYAEPLKSDFSNSKSEHSKGKDSGLIFPPNQDFTSLSTQENDSIISNLLGMSPTSSTSGKKLEWDSGADVGYLNMDLTKENISTIERIILKGLSDDGLSKKKVIYQRTEQEMASRPSKFILERMSSELEIEMKNNSTSKRSSSDQSSIPSRITNTSTTTSHSLSSHSLSDGAGVCVTKPPKNTESNDSGAEKYQSSSTDKSNKHKISKRSKVVHNKQDSKSGKKIDEAKKREASSDSKSTNKEEKFVQTPNIDTNKEIVQSSDKSTYVNTLFSDFCFELPLQDLSRSEESGRSESSDKVVPCVVPSPRVKKLKKKRNVVQGSNLTARLKDKIETIIDIARHSNRSSERPKSDGSVKHSETVESDHEKPDTVGEVSVERKQVKSDPTPLCSPEKTNQKDKTAASRPISASSSSIRTVMPSVDPSEDVKPSVKNFSDQMIQTCELMYESKGIQAFQSAKCSTSSSQLGEGTTRNTEERRVDISGVEFLKEDSVCRSILSFSKSIQAPGMNSSLPRHLAHPKQPISCEQVNTKATQFFGGPVTSLPNYHSNVPVKEYLVGKDKILKNKVNSNTENNRVIQENTRNSSQSKPNGREVVIECILAPEGNANAKPIDDESDMQRKRLNKEPKKNKIDVEDKENLSVEEEELTDYSKRQSNCSRKESKTNCSMNNGSKKSDSVAFGSCEVLPSDDGKNVFLTSDLLKEHGDQIDRNIIQEKYFQSQLIELERREMVSRTTSMEKKSEHERNTQTSFSPVTGVSVSCQYSPSLINRNEEMPCYSKTDSGKSTGENGPTNAWVHQSGQDECDSSQRKKNGKRLNTLEGSGNDEFVLIESLSSDTQTANSWVPDTQQGSENQLGRALSFEYLPGHIYDDPASLRGKSVSLTEHNQQMGDSAQSNGTYSTPATNSRVKNSESGHTLVLENTDRSSLESDRMKSLNNNLTELEMVVSRLHEKEAIFQKITDSVLSTVSKVNGSGDSSLNQKDSTTNDNSNGMEEISCEGEVLEESSKSNGSEDKSRGKKEKSHGINEISTACQTDTLKPDPSRLDEERKQLEQKMTDEKEQQIKWIENEIKHLITLRSLLEKQEDVNNSTQRKKRHHYLTEAAEGRSATATLKEEVLRKILTDCLSKTPPTPVEFSNGNESKSPPLKLTEEHTTKTLKQLSGPFATTSECPQLAFSLRRVDNVREVTMLPVGIQVTLRDKKERRKSSPSPEKRNDSTNTEQSGVHTKHPPTISTTDFRRQSETQPSSLNNQYISNTPTLGSVDSVNRCGCFKCSNSKCVCLKMPESSDRRRSSRSSSQQSKTREPAGASSAIMNEEALKQSIKIPEIRDIDDSGGGSSMERPSGEVSYSSKKQQSFASSEGSLHFEKCVCICHSQPLPRCGSCHLLNTCKQCQCYRRIKCCICEVSASKVSLPKKCLTISASCHGKADPCKMCPCHMKVGSEASPCKCKRKYKERSCQTEGKECICCQCSEPVVNESDLYRGTKYMSEKRHVTEKRKSTDVVYPAEKRHETEIKHSVDERFPYQMKVPMEKKTSSEVKNATQMKTEVEKLNAEPFQSLPVRELIGKKQCSCMNRQTRRKSFEDYPRHYFLELEETTEEESSESCDNRTSLEVITIKVPIRKVCNGGRNMQSSPVRHPRKTKENGDIGNRYSEQKITEGLECNCCEDCIGHSRKRSPVEERPRTADYSPPRASYESKQRQYRNEDICMCCQDCPGRAKLEERPRPEFAICDDYEQRKTKSVSYTEFNTNDENECCRNCSDTKSNKPLKYPSDESGSRETQTQFSSLCNCCDCCTTDQDRVEYNPESGFTSRELNKNETPTWRSDPAEYSSTAGSEALQSLPVKENDQPPEGKKERRNMVKPKTNKSKKDGEKVNKVHKSPSVKPCLPHEGSKPKPVKGAAHDKSKDKCKTNDYYNFNKKEYMTKSELEREEKKKRPTRLTLQECLTIKRPDLFTRAECRRKIISEKSKDRAERHNKRLECITKLLPQCDVPSKNPDLKLFTSAEMRKQTKKFCKKLPEVANKQAEEKKKMAFQTNKLMAEIFAKKLQLQTLKGRLNMSNSFTVMSTM